MKKVQRGRTENSKENQEEASPGCLKVKGQDPKPKGRKRDHEGRGGGVGI